MRGGQPQSTLMWAFTIIHALSVYLAEKMVKHISFHMIMKLLLERFNFFMEYMIYVTDTFPLELMLVVLDFPVVNTLCRVDGSIFYQSHNDDFAHNCISFSN